MKLKTAVIELNSKLSINIEAMGVSSVREGVLSSAFVPGDLENPPTVSTVYRARILMRDTNRTYGYLEAPTLPDLKDIVTLYLTLWGYYMPESYWILEVD